MTYAHHLEHLIDHLARLSLAIDRLAAMRAGVSTDELDAALAMFDAEIARKIATSTIELPIEQVAERFGLSRRAVLLLLAASLSGLDVGLAERWRAAIGGGPEPRVYELVDLVAQDSRGELVEELGPDQPLQDALLVRLASGREWAGQAPLLQRLVTVPDCVVSALRGAPILDRELASIAAPVVPAGEPDAALTELLAERGTPVVVVGPELVGKATAIANAARGRGTLAARLDVIAATGEGLRLLAELECQTRVRDDVLVLRAGDGLEALPLPLRRAVVELVDRGGAVLTVRDRSCIRELRAPRVVELGVPSQAQQIAMWRTQLGPTVADLDAVVARCSLPIGEIVEAAAAAPRAPSTAQLLECSRARLQHRLRDVASIVTTTLAWSDLVVREDLSQRIFEIIAAVHYRSHVLDTWGFADKLPYGRSISALLSGPPGTGKTMVATLIAKELGLELFRVDLSKVVSKWLGETEKNLGKVFDEATRVGAVLLFDEADALFGKRTEVKSSNDRNANLEVNYLLQRLEQHDGIVLLTTNLASSIDDAFKRRLRFRIDFPRPEANEREALWRVMIPPRAPLADDVDLAAIADRFTMAGGHIKNAVVRAAFLAAERGACAIDHATLMHAATLEWTELGNLPT